MTLPSRPLRSAFIVMTSFCLGSGALDAQAPTSTPTPTPALVTFPQLRSALLAGGLLAFALSFDEIIVTTFTIGAGETTLPIWILQNLFRPNQAPVVNVVAVVLIVVSIVPIWLAQKLSGDSVRVSGARLKADER